MLAVSLELFATSLELLKSAADEFAADEFAVSLELLAIEELLMGISGSHSGYGSHCSGRSTLEDESEEHAVKRATVPATRKVTLKWGVNMP
jgi:hypothetical protein